MPKRVAPNTLRPYGLPTSQLWRSWGRRPYVETERTRRSITEFLKMMADSKKYKLPPSVIAAYRRYGAAALGRMALAIGAGGSAVVGAVGAAAYLVYHLYNRYTSTGSIEEATEEVDTEMGDKDGSVVYKGLGDVPASLSNNSIRRYRLRSGKPNKKRLFQQNRAFLISRFQSFQPQSTSASKFGVYGLWPGLLGMVINPNPVSLISTVNNAAIPSTFGCTMTALPMYAYNLSALSQGRVRDDANNTVKTVYPTGTSALPAVLYQLMRMQAGWYPVGGDLAVDGQSVVFYQWHPVRSSRSGSNGTSDYFSPVVESNNVVVDKPAPMYSHDWSEIMIQFYGARYRPTCVKASIVNFLNEDCGPSRVWFPSLAAQSDFTGGFFNRDVTDNNLQNANKFSKDVSLGLVPNLGPAVYESTNTTIGTIGTNGMSLTENMCTVVNFWDSYWQNRLGHPMSYAKNYGAHKKMWKTKFSKCIQIGPTRSDNNDGLVHTSMVKIFKRFNKVFDTQNKSVPPKVTATQPFFPLTAIGTNYLAAGYSTNDQTVNQHIFTTKRSAEDWLIIEAENPYQVLGSCGVSNTPVGYNSAGFTCSGYFTLGGDSTSTTLDGATIATNAFSPSFDISVRSKYEVVSAQTV